MDSLLFCMTCNKVTRWQGGICQEHAMTATGITYPQADTLSQYNLIRAEITAVQTRLHALESQISTLQSRLSPLDAAIAAIYSLTNEWQSYQKRTFHLCPQCEQVKLGEEFNLTDDYICKDCRERR